MKSGRHHELLQAPRRTTEPGFTVAFLFFIFYASYDSYERALWTFGDILTVAGKNWNDEMTETGYDLGQHRPVSSKYKKGDRSFGCSRERMSQKRKTE